MNRFLSIGKKWYWKNVTREARVTFFVNDCTLYNTGVCRVQSGIFQRLPVWLLFLFLYLITGIIVPAGANETRTIKLTDPVYPKKPKRQHTLIVYRDSQGFPSGYSMKLINEVCLDDVCKLVDVTMYWDAIGFYQRLECPKDQPLTKLEHDPFTVADYKKLDSVLKDQKSILNDHSLGFLATEKDSGAASAEENKKGDIDGVSRATPGAVKEAVVKDAAWTTWVLWKYANTDIVAILRTKTESHCSEEYLNHLLDSKDWQKIEFALKYCLKQKSVTDQYIDKVAKLLPTAGIDHIELAIEYIKQATQDRNTCYRKLIGALETLNVYNAALVIELLESDQNLSNEILVDLTSCLDKQSFYPIHLALRLVEDRKFFSKEVEENVVKLLQSKDFFIARRAGEFLSKQKLSSSTREKLQAFREKNADRL